MDKRVSKKGQEYYITTIIDSESDESEGYGKDFKVGDRIEVWHDTKYDKTKFQK